MAVQEYFADCLKDFDRPDNWEDVSYHNDVCPSFECNGYQIFVDHPDPKKRELGEETHRFVVIISLEYGVTGWTHSTDSLAEVLKEIETPYMTRTLYYDEEEYLKEEMRRRAS